MGRSFSVRQRQPAMFAVLCDELTQAVAGGRLSEPLREWLQASAIDQLESFLDDFMETPPPVQVSDNVLYACVCMCVGVRACVCMCMCMCKCILCTNMSSF